MTMLDDTGRAGRERAGLVRDAHEACLTSGLRIAAGVSASADGRVAAGRAEPV